MVALPRVTRAPHTPARRASHAGPQPPNEPVRTPDSAPTDKSHAQATLLAAVVTTAVVTALSYLLPEAYSATGVGAAFLVATYLLALRDDDAAVRHHGLALGGLLERARLDPGRLARDSGVATVWAVAVAAVVLPPFWLGYWVYHGRPDTFAAAAFPSVGNEVLGQLLVIALPEEAFYRGVLQTRFDDAWGARWRWLGTRVGPGLLVTSALFAVGHMATEVYPSRLAVFFPALLFGWLRCRTGSIGASILLHALCNLFATYLASSYGLPG